MKEKLFKKSTSVVAILIIFAMIATMFLPNYVKSAQVVVSNVTNTGRGVGNVGVYTAKISGYSNLYCVRGGARLEDGMQLNDNGVSLYNTTGSIVTNSSAIQWLLDNMYLTEGTDANTQALMKENLKNIMKKYNTYKDANGTLLLNKKLNGNGINDAWINNAVEDVVSDPATLYAIQQYAIWNHVSNMKTYYYNVMQNSDGTYNAIPNAKAKQIHYTALYITLNELAAEAQSTGYKSPNASGNGYNIKIQEQGNVKKALSSDRKVLVFGPYKLVNNTSMVNKTFTATVNSEKADKVETIDSNGKAVSVSGTQGEFYLKVTYNKGFAKGVDYNINVDVALNGLTTTASLLDTTNAGKQPLVAIRKSPYTTTTKASIHIKEELNGSYNLVLEKVDSTNVNKKLAGVTFNVKTGSGEAVSYGPTGSDGKVTVVNKKEITEQSVNVVDEYTITKEISLGENNEDYIKIAEPITVYVTKTNNGNAYVLANASFDKNSDQKTIEVELKDGTTALAQVSVIGDTVKVTVPNKPKEEPKFFDIALRKYISEVKRDGANVDIGVSRSPRIDATSATEYLRTNTAAYYHVKDPITVNAGDTVIYTINIYNEGYQDGYAKEVTDYLPAELEFVENSEINKANGWTAVKNSDGTTTIKTNKLANTLIPAAKGAKGFLSYDADRAMGETGEPKFSKTLQIECKVKESKVQKLLVNIAEISNYGYNDENGNYVEAKQANIDIDSEENNVFTKNSSVKSIDTYYENVVKPQYSEKNNYYRGSQDDDDFENVIVLPKIELKGEYNLELEKVDITDANKKLAGVTFNVITGSGEATSYGPTGSNGKVTVVSKKQITEQNVNVVDEYTITKEISLGENEGYIKISEPITVYVTKSSNGKEYIASNVSLDKEKDVTSKEVTLEDGSKAVVSATLNNNTVTVTIPNKPEPKEEPKEFDMALRKYITEVIRNGETVAIESRTPVINEESAKEYEANKTAAYYHTKNPITVKPGDTVIYTLRVYNEGEVAGFAKEITDYLPAGLEYVENSQINKENGWKATKNQDGTTTVKTSKLNGVLIPAANGKEGFEKYAKEVAEGKTDAPEFSKAVIIECKVKDDVEDAKLLLNVAEITNYGYNDEDGNYIEANKTKIDIDSEENNVFTVNSNVKNIDEYYKNVVKTTKTADKNLYKGIQDDDDFENVIVEVDKKFDLALRKFITSITNGYGDVEEVKSRIPVFKVDENGNYVYNHSKEPVLVANDNIVTYTIRVYNEGEVNGYAEEVKDDIPEGLEFVPEDDTNVKYRWVMLDKDEKETTDPSKAKYIITDYLSIEQEKTKGSNLIKAFNLNDYESGVIKEPDYKEVKVSFKVKTPDKSEEIIINHAQISEDLDENGNSVDDIDSTPNKWVEGEDDQDVEPVKVQWFDLSLRKWVTKAIVIENGVETVTETGHKAEDNPESTVKVDLKTSSIKDITVKFEYKIRVKNESPIAGYAKEVTDYIPQGLKFVKEDNPDWEEKEDGVIVTDALKDTLLKKDETAEVTVVLTWINNENNMGLKVNVAEISKDYNKYGAKDVDSTPNNKVPGEDDIDDAPVMLTPKTGEEATYVVLSAAVLIIIAGGLVAIKKFVL